MPDLGIGAILPIAGRDNALCLVFRCGCKVIVAKCEMAHPEGPCGIWAIGHGLSFLCVNHYLILNDPRSAN